MNSNLLRRLLNWPLVWRWAAKKAVVMPHTQGYCLPCLAKMRLERNKHALGEAPTGVAVCKKCGLIKEQWANAPRCSNSKPLLPPVRKVRTYKIMNVD